jgi:hypothetical protein
MAAVILPSARSRDTLSEAGRLTSNNLCRAIPLKYYWNLSEGNSVTILRLISASVLRPQPSDEERRRRLIVVH